MDQDNQVRMDSQGIINNCFEMTVFNTSVLNTSDTSSIVNLCNNDSWVTSQGAPYGWVHSRCPITCGLCYNGLYFCESPLAASCDSNNATEVGIDLACRDAVMQFNSKGKHGGSGLSKGARRSTQRECATQLSLDEY